MALPPPPEPSTGRYDMVGRGTSDRMIYYYSLTGTCERIATKLAERLHCSTERIVEKTKRPSRGPLRFLNGGAAAAGRASRIVACTNEPSRFDQIIVVTPVWAGSPTPAIRGFAKQYGNDLHGKTLGLVVVNLGSEPESALAKCRKLFPEPLLTKSFTKARGDWEETRQNELIEEFVQDIQR